MAWLPPELDEGAEPELKPLDRELLELFELPKLDEPELEADEPELAADPELELPGFELPELVPEPGFADPVDEPADVLA